MIISRQQVVNALKAYGMLPGPGVPGNAPGPVPPAGPTVPPGPGAAGGERGEPHTPGPVATSVGSGSPSGRPGAVAGTSPAGGAAGAAGVAGSSGAGGAGGLQGPVTAPRDRVDLSPEAAAIRRLVEEARRLPDVRPERVAALRQQIARGEYAVDPEQVAERMLYRLLADRAQEGR
ncbi:Anti-sigma-28 factor FlgM family protein [Thermaerobacter marianensis DSM 12885]|uniref:Negative regulator of flagellin synthesis n=1 Tax=Thermaerobacter marianensis (strain ATCC 700841 / DSM 12885 / JCM 10246 / 7p75a) TaxID=644966 RepID=E6SLQ0_THEM7|nr:flagellar biosynthesis anti-sigma factor FlgM [Thermaerobacter marianensis]ADU50317.1 Anti-sigma-28 factor FlgM family protein [Thermaerobacter marianensis DSM 12885]